jgi:methylmalonyl-CoA/ethylmalonyl-CoA epimerase
MTLVVRVGLPDRSIDGSWASDLRTPASEVALRWSEVPQERHDQGMELVQVAQRATDLDRAATFYTDLLGGPPAARFDPPGLVFFDLAGTRLLLDVNAPSALLYLRVDDLEATVERLRTRGVPVESEPHVIFTHEDATLGPAGTQEWHAFVRDPDGNLVGLVSQRP